jgi:3-hydroxyisobutyrate dehydrogenase-like beta-hydroxyacid dehydrogenase
MKLGFIGYGEAAYELSLGLRQQGFEQIIAYDPLWDHPTFGPVVQERSKQAQVELAEEAEQVLKVANMVIVAVPADKAYEVSKSLKPFLKNECAYIDVSASTPDVKKKISANVKEMRGTFVDAAMMGPLPVYKHKVPIIASGDGTDTFINVMSPYGMHITKVSDTPGDASAVKLVRSIFMKGIAGLFIEMLDAAYTFNVQDYVIDSVSETMDSKSFEYTLNRMVTGTSIHSLRRAVELEGSIQMLETANINSTMSKATKNKLKSLSEFNLRDKFQGKTPDNWEDVIKALQENKNSTTSSY